MSPSLFTPLHFLVLFRFTFDLHLDRFLLLRIDVLKPGKDRQLPSVAKSMNYLTESVDIPHVF